MYIDDALLTGKEKIIFTLRGLYAENGYSAYRMNKFEAYDLYMRNKDFLLSDSIITFTDTNGTLMALKPDVTLSIVKNSRYSAQKNQKLCYDEKVYRPGRKGDPFREITQIGLENLGEIGEQEITEVLDLALRTLSAVSPSFVLDISCLDLLSRVLDEMEAGRDTREKLLLSLSEKSLHETKKICHEAAIPEEKIALLESLLSCEGPAEEAIRRLEAISWSGEAKKIAGSLISVLQKLAGRPVRLDFSVQSDMRYYNGIVFSGFAEGIPEAVLRGGQYDRLLRRVGRPGGAIGFALYPDLLD